jgi:hypothetical protein
MTTVSAGAYWFRIPDNEAALMSLKPAELKCFLVVLHLGSPNALARKNTAAHTHVKWP